MIDGQTFGRVLVVYRGTIGLEDKGVYQSQYATALEEMCRTGTTEWSEARDRRLCHSCRVVRPLRSKHSPSLNVDKCVPRFDHHCPWVGTTVGYNNHPWFMAYAASAAGCLSSCSVICIRFLLDQTSHRHGRCE